MYTLVYREINPCNTTRHFLQGPVGSSITRELISTDVPGALSVDEVFSWALKHHMDCVREKVGYTVTVVFGEACNVAA
jgi:hypothetical protein